MTDKKITQSEVAELFGGEIPMEALTLLWEAPADMTVAEVRQKLNEMAARRSPAQSLLEEAREIANELYPLSDKLNRAAALGAEAALQSREALIGEMREPTPEMIEAGDALIPWTRGTESYRDIPTPEEMWRAMFDARLTPKGDGE